MGKTVTVLIVDDSEMNRTIYKRFLTGICTVISAKSGFEALENITKQKIDLILVDIAMPKMDGYQLAEKIRCFSDYYSEVPIIGLTTYGNHSTCPPVFKACLQVPFTKSELIEKVKYHLRLD